MKLLPILGLVLIAFFWGIYGGVMYSDGCKTEPSTIAPPGNDEGIVLNDYSDCELIEVADSRMYQCPK